MNISVKSEYALKAVFELASQSLKAPAGASMPPVKIARIAKRQKIPQKFLELILAGLKQNGFVDSRRGTEGGYILARRPETITVGEVLRAVENVKSAGRAQKGDPFCEIWMRVDAAVSSVLDETSFGQLVQEFQAKHTKYIPNWEI